MADDLPELLVPDATAWRAWLAENQASPTGVWLVLHKKGGDVTALTYDEAVEEALCVGWIDGQARSRDTGSTFIRMTPRRPRSIWSARNVERVARLEAQGRMTDAGRAQVRAAQADGRWDRAYGGDVLLDPPADLAVALAADPRAQAWFDVLTRSNRNAVIFQVLDARRPETRARRIARIVDDLAQGRPPYPQKARPPQHDSPR